MATLQTDKKLTGTALFVRGDYYLQKQGEGMPTNNDEARQIVGIINEYIDEETAKAITARLHEQVGRHTENESLAVSLEMLKALYEDHSQGAGGNED
jgi:hypothetical protein